MENISLFQQICMMVGGFVILGLSLSIIIIIIINIILRPDDGGIVEDEQDGV